MNQSLPKASPVVVSFYCGDSYYYEAADTLRDDCARLGLDSDIVELKKRPEEGWLQICRRKIPFYLEMHRKHERPILWLDVDSRLVQYPKILEGATCDFSAGTSRKPCNSIPSASRQNERAFSMSSTTTAT